MRIKKIRFEEGTKCQECGNDANMLLETEDGDNPMVMCTHCYLNRHDRDRIRWYSRIWTLKSMMEHEEKKNKPKKPKWGIRGLIEKD